MCLISFAYKYPEDFYLVLAANRDEFYSRKTRKADYWEENSEIWGGKDLEGGGTWMGIRKDGKFSFLTNYRNLHLDPVLHPKSRGNLVREFLLNDDSAEEYIDRIRDSGNEYEGFNLVVGDLNSAIYWNNRKDLILDLPPGVYALSNGILDEPWFKTDRLKNRFTEELEKMAKGISENPPSSPGIPGQGQRWSERTIDLASEAFFSILKDTTQAPDDRLPDTGLEKWKEKALSSSFIQTPGYGTRSSTYVALKQSKGDLAPHILHLQEKTWVA